MVRNKTDRAKTAALLVALAAGLAEGCGGNSHSSNDTPSIVDAGAGGAGHSDARLNPGSQGGSGAAGESGTGGKLDAANIVITPGSVDGGGPEVSSGSGGNGGSHPDGGPSDSGDCVDGQQQCVDGQAAQIQTCTAGHWIASSCASYSVCVTDACLPICDGMLASATIPSVCFFPLNQGNGLFLWSNDAVHFPTSSNAFVDVRVWDGHTPKPVLIGSSTAWPYYWRLTYPLDVALVGFALGSFTPPVQNATLWCKVRRANSISAVTNELFAVSNGNIFGMGSLTAPTVWRTDNFAVQSPSTQSFNYNTSFNFLDLAVTGDGFGDAPDALDLNWFLLQITP